MIYFKKYMTASVIILMCLNISLSNGLRILGLFVMNMKSHYIPCEVLMKSLAEKGHQIDVYGHYPPKKSIPGLNFYSLEGTLKHDLNLNLTIEEMQQIATTDIMKGWINNYIPGVCDLMGLPIFQKLLHNPPTDPPYDLVVIELSGSYCYLPFANHLNVPMVTIITLPFLIEWLYEPMGLIFNYATDSGINFAHSTPMTFFERLQNWFEVNQFSNLYNHLLFVQDVYAQKYFGPQVSKIEEIVKNISLVLLEHNFALNEVRPLPPKVIPVSGMHIIDNNETLNKKVQNWLDDSKAGCIYFSFGSIVQFETFSRSTIDAFYASFKKISPVRVLMKADPEKLPLGIPPNVLVQPWFQQTQVLKHKNIKAFVTHGGLMSMQESVYHGVPMICIPIFGDQRYNTEVSIKKKIAIKIHLPEMTEKTFTNAVKDIIENPEYKSNVLKISKIFKDRPMSPIDTAVYWIEFIHRHGRDAIRSPVVDMPWWQLHLLDVYAFIGLSGLAILCVIAKVCKMLIELSASKLSRNIGLCFISKSHETVTTK